MSAREMDIEVGTSQAEDQPPADPVELDRWIDWKLRRIQQLVEQKQHNASVVQAEIDRLTSWRDDENATLQRSIDWFEEQIRMASLAYPFNGKKSRKLPHGTFGYRTSGGRTLVTDMKAAVAFAREHDIPVQETVLVSHLKEYANSTGETLPFVEAEPAFDKFFVTVKPEGAR